MPITDPATLQMTKVHLDEVTDDPKQAQSELAGNVDRYNALTGILKDLAQFTIAATSPALENDGAEGLRVKVKSGGGIKRDGNGLSLEAAPTKGRVLIGDGINWSQIDPGANGTVLTADSAQGAGAKWAALAATRLTAVTVFTASGTWTKPAGLDHLVVEVWGGGGNGGSSGGSGGSANGGGGGGAGGYAAKRIAAAALANETVTVGGAGGTSSFGAHASATGGANGVDSGGSGGAGGSGSGGEVNFTGQGGQAGNSTGTAGLGRGGVGGGLAGGRSVSTGTGGAGSAPGGGGGGGSSGASSGGAGGAGLVVVWEYGS